MWLSANQRTKWPKLVRKVWGSVLNRLYTFCWLATSTAATPLASSSFILAFLLSVVSSFSPCASYLLIVLGRGTKLHHLPLGWASLLLLWQFAACSRQSELVRVTRDGFYSCSVIRTEDCVMRWPLKAPLIDGFETLRCPPNASRPDPSATLPVHVNKCKKKGYLCCV